MLSRTWYAEISAANTNRDGTGDMEEIVRVPSRSNGGWQVDKVRMVAQGTTTAGVVRLFLDDGRGGSQGISLIHEELVSAITPSTTVEVWSAEVEWTQLIDDTVLLYRGLYIPRGGALFAATHNAETFTVLAHGRRPE